VKKQVIAGVLIVAAITAIFLGTKWFGKKEVGIIATGTIEVTKVDIAPKLSGYLTELSIRQGDKVNLGQVIARISRVDLEAQALRDEAALQKAEAQLRDLEKGVRTQERSELIASIGSAEAVDKKAQADLERYRSLYNQGAVSQQQWDTAQVNFETAQSSVRAAQARLSLADEGNRPDTIEAQRLEVVRSKAILTMARTQMADTVVSSPQQGVVLTKNFEKGEFVNAGSAIATIGNVQDCWVKIYIPSTQLGLIKIGQPAVVKVDSYPGKTFSGEIKEISQNAEFTPRQSLTQNERANMVYAVKVRIDNAEDVLKPGMPADVVIK
jgi:HlyD family secretion protein